MDYALKYIGTLQRYEKAASVLNLQKIKVIEEGNETPAFLKLWETSAVKPELGNMAMIVEEWTHLFRDVSLLLTHSFKIHSQSNPDIPLSYPQLRAAQAQAHRRTIVQKIMKKRRIMSVLRHGSSK